MGKYRKKPLSVALDVDDVLFRCVSYAMERCNERFHITPPLEEREMTQWGSTGRRTDIVLEEFKDPDFFRTQPLIDGAIDFVKKLVQVADVYFLTAVPPICMGVRAERLMKEFPDVPSDHIIMTSSKNMVEVDVLLDDGGHNIFSTRAKYPVLMRKPWNQNITGVLAVNNYKEFLTLIKEIKSRFVEANEEDMNTPPIICFVGPSGSGKSELTNNLVSLPGFEKPVSYTTRKMRVGEKDGADYHFVDTDTFRELVEKGDIFEHTVYAGEYYGTSIGEIEGILVEGNAPVLPIDICGAMGLKAAFSNAITIFVDRKKTDLIRSVIERSVPVDDKVNRIISMDAEMKNEEICDYTVRNYTTINDAIKQVLDILE